MPDKLLFLTSSRFWQFAVAIALWVSISNGYLPEGSIESIATIVAMLSATSATVGTVDRFAEYNGS